MYVYIYMCVCSVYIYSMLEFTFKNSHFQTQIILAKNNFTEIEDPWQMHHARIS